MENNPIKLKLGLVSADFGNHPGGFFTLSLLKELRKKNFELIAYPTNERQDEFSHHFKPLFSKWISIKKKSGKNPLINLLPNLGNILPKYSFFINRKGYFI